MIFVTVGTEKFPFDRLLKAIDEALQKKETEQEIFAQTGCSIYKPQFFSHKEYIDFGEMVKFIQKSDIVITHAGIGTAILCLSLGKIPILFPRDVAFGEHLDNHQIDFARKMEVFGKVLVAFDYEELINKIKDYKKIVSSLKLSSTSNHSKRELITYLKKITI